jgi:hypothetical protein
VVARRDPRDLDHWWLRRTGAYDSEPSATRRRADQTVSTGRRQASVFGDVRHKRRADRASARRWSNADGRPTVDRERSAAPVLITHSKRFAPSRHRLTAHR